MATLSILARFRPQEKYILSIFMHLMRRESPGHGWLWRDGPPARAAAELAEDRSGLELGVRPLAGGAEFRVRLVRLLRA
jgi:hypothetical protein